MSDPRNMVAPEDRKFILETPDDGFSPERNKFIIEKSIKDYEAMRAKKMKAHDDAYAERADAIATYLNGLAMGGRSSSIEKYFGKRTLAYLRGDEIRQKLMANMKIYDREGNLIRKGI